MRFRNLLVIATLGAATLPISPTAVAGEKEKIVKLDDIPAPARQTILHEAKGAPVVRVEQEQQGGKTVYEGVVKQGKSEVGIVVDANGTLLGKHNEKSEKHE